MSEQLNGTVRVKDGNKAPVDYGVNREVEASISFFVDDAARLDAVARLAANVADSIVNEKLGRAADKAVSSKAVVEVSPEKPERRTRVPKAETKETKPATDPAAMPGAEPQQAIQTGGERVNPESKADAADMAGLDDVLTGSVPVITDNDLMATITQHNAKTKNAAAIRALIGKYVPQDGKPHQAAEIEQSKRQAFKDELAKIGAPS
jgi:hypothetical protein